MIHCVLHENTGKSLLLNRWEVHYCFKTLLQSFIPNTALLGSLVFFFLFVFNVQNLNGTFCFLSCLRKNFSDASWVETYGSNRI